MKRIIYLVLLLQSTFFYSQEEVTELPKETKDFKYEFYSNMDDFYKAGDKIAAPYQCEEPDKFINVNLYRKDDCKGNPVMFEFKLSDKMKTTILLNDNGTIRYIKSSDHIGSVEVVLDNGKITHYLYDLPEGRTFDVKHLYREVYHPTLFLLYYYSNHNFFRKGNC